MRNAVGVHDDAAGDRAEVRTDPKTIGNGNQKR